MGRLVGYRVEENNI